MADRVGQAKEGARVIGSNAGKVGSVMLCKQ